VLGRGASAATRDEQCDSGVVKHEGLDLGSQLQLRSSSHAMPVLIAIDRAGDDQVAIVFAVTREFLARKNVRCKVNVTSRKVSDDLHQRRSSIFLGSR
jgi:hypothetical protein